MMDSSTPVDSQMDDSNVKYLVCSIVLLLSEWWEVSLEGLAIYKVENNKYVSQTHEDQERDCTALPENSLGSDEEPATVAIL